MKNEKACRKITALLLVVCVLLSSIATPSIALAQSGELDVPQNVKAVAISDSEINLTWDAVPNALGYDVEADGYIIDAGAETSYAHSGLVAGSEHNYRIRAKNVDGVGNWSEIVTQAVLNNSEGSPVKLEAPQNIQAISTSGSAITVTWDNVNGADGYEIEVDGTIVNNGNSTEYSHTELVPGSQHSYKVRQKYLMNEETGVKL